MCVCVCVCVSIYIYILMFWMWSCVADGTVFQSSAALGGREIKAIQVEGRCWQPCDSVVHCALLVEAGSRSPRVTDTHRQVPPTTADVDGHVGLIVANDWCGHQISTQATAQPAAKRTADLGRIKERKIERRFPELTSCV